MAKRGATTGGKKRKTGGAKKTRQGKKTAGRGKATKRNDQRSKRSKSTSSSSSASKKKHGHRKGGKAPSGFNLYMKTILPKIKQEHPGIGHKEAFKKATEQWASSPDNPKNAHH